MDYIILDMWESKNCVLEIMFYLCHSYLGRKLTQHQQTDQDFIFGHVKFFFLFCWAKGVNFQDMHLLIIWEAKILEAS